MALIVEHVDFEAQAFEHLLGVDAEPLLFVDDQQSQVFEADVLLHEPVRADDDVDFARFHSQQRLVLLGLGAESREDVHVERELGQPLAEGPVVLLGEHGGRHQHGHLLPRFDRLERGPHRHFGLAVADVAAQAGDPWAADAAYLL